MKLSCECYFCGQETAKTIEQKGYSAHYDCLDCQRKFNHKRVITTLYEDGRLMYAHIFTNDDWQIRLNLEENITVIEPALTTNPTIVIPGYLITLANAKEKLKLCLIYR